jgi:uncharacterized protein (TIGR03083 family)
VESTDLHSAEQDGRALLVAAQIQWDRPVPHCPGWDEAELVRHMGSVMRWQGAIVSTGERVNRRTLEPAPPENPDDLPDWYLAVLSQTLQAFEAADPEKATWTFSRVGDQRAGWWRRRLAVEVATHRWDAEHAVTYDDQGGASPQPIDGEVAAAGIEEFVVEFLPGLLAREGVEGIAGSLRLLAEDGPTEWWINLDGDGKAMSEAQVEVEGQADTTIRGTRSDLLLWLQNRGPLETLEISGDQTILDRWGQLSF